MKLGSLLSLIFTDTKLSETYFTIYTSTHSEEAERVRFSLMYHLSSDGDSVTFVLTDVQVRRDGP